MMKKKKKHLNETREASMKRPEVVVCRNMFLFIFVCFCLVAVVFVGPKNESVVL